MPSARVCQSTQGRKPCLPRTGFRYTIRAMGRSTASTNPAPRRSRVEQEILRCAAIGEAADFTGPQWKRVKRVDGRVVVSGDFLASVWLGLTETRIHPTEIVIRGLHIQGTVSVNYARADACLRTPLAAISAFNCFFTGGIGLAHARCGSISLHDCIIGEPDPAPDDIDGSPPPPRHDAIVALGTEIVGMLTIAGCRIDSDFTLMNGAVDDAILITNTEFRTRVSLGGSELRAGLTLLNCRAPSIAALGIEVGAEMVLAGCRFSEGADFRYTKLRSVQITSCSFGKTGLELSEARIDGRLSIMGSRIAGPVSAFAVACRTMTVQRTIAGNLVDIRRSSIAGDFLVDRSRFRQGISATALSVTGQAAFTFSRCTAAPSSDCSADFGNSRFGKVDLILSRFVGTVRLDDAEFASLECSSVSIIHPPAGDHRSADSCSISGWRARIRADLTFRTCATEGNIRLTEAQIGGRVNIAHGWFGSSGDCVALCLSSARIGSVAIFDHVVVTGQLNLVSAALNELQFYECRIGMGRRDEDGPKIGLRAEELRAFRSVVFVKPDTPEEAGTIIDGAVVFSNALIENYLAIESLTVRSTWGGDPQRSAVALTLAGATVRKEVTIGTLVRPGCGFTVEGALVLENLATDSIEIGAATTLRALGSGPGNHSGWNSPQLLRHKQAVALSMRNATVAKRTSISPGLVAGLIDLRDAALGSLADRGGLAWQDDRQHSGTLMLDGLTYSGLDDDSQQDANGRGGATAHPTDAVARRLDWLAMQYPDGEPDASSFTPQPYEQLARHYASLGDERARRQVLVRKRQLQRQHSGLGRIEQAVSGLLGLTSDYGYSPGKASIASALLIAVGAAAAWGLHAAGAIVPVKDADGSGVFSPLLYAIDVAVPFLDLGHDGNWRIDPGQLPFWPGRTLTLGLAEALYRLAGLVMLSITVLTFSGILHEKE